MHALLRFAAAMLASVLLFTGVVSVLERPLTLGDVPRQLEYKHAFARTLAGPRVVVFAGSNGRYSHRCAALAAALGRPCVNMSVAVGVGLDYLLDDLLTMLRPGDLVYMPLEYQQYEATRDEMEGGHQNPILVQRQRDRLWVEPLPRVLRAYGYFDLGYLVHGVIETALYAAGFQRRTSLATLTPEGDERGHDRRAAAPYRDYVRGARFELRPLPPQSHARSVIESFLDRAHALGVVVIGGLPTVPDDVPLTAAHVDGLRSLYEGRRQHFLALDGLSRHPRDCFFDTLSHLVEECQWQHSRRVGTALAAMLPVPSGATARTASSASR